MCLWYGMVNVDLYSAIITKVSNALFMSVLKSSTVFSVHCCVVEVNAERFVR